MRPIKTLALVITCALLWTLVACEKKRAPDTLDPSRVDAAVDDRAGSADWRDDDWQNEDWRKDAAAPTEEPVVAREDEPEEVAAEPETADEPEAADEPNVVDNDDYDPPAQDEPADDPPTDDLDDY